ncbi:hypothetical protein EJ08DRAFT_659116 [Tothia fuscella]|uniref:Uncharacterized protein n=1 Tax=Tothia fuscella TaxID=1048955 RepID=A0A9P4U0Y9_9PEZI|nr:hypothetical protein EJ08DRAFT_659116 [Tothia fuscella]
MPFILSTAVLLIPAVFALPVPQTLTSTITGPDGRPTSGSTLSGLDTTLTLGTGPQNSLPYNGGGNQPPCRSWNCNPNNPNNGNNNWPNNGNNWPNNGDNWPKDNNGGEWVNNPNIPDPWANKPDNGYAPYRPGPDNRPYPNLPDAPGGPAGTATVSIYGSKAHSEGEHEKSKRDDPKEGWWNWFIGSSGLQLGSGSSANQNPSSVTVSGPQSGRSGDGQAFGGLTSGITLGGGK